MISSYPTFKMVKDGGSLASEVYIWAKLLGYGIRVQGLATFPLTTVSRPSEASFL